MRKNILKMISVLLILTLAFGAVACNKADKAKNNDMPMIEDGKGLSLKFLPYTLLLSFLLSVVVSLVYAKVIKNNVTEIKNVTDKMMTLDKEAILEVDTRDEIGDLKEQIFDLYTTLLKSIDDLEEKIRKLLN